MRAAFVLAVAAGAARTILSEMIRDPLDLAGASLGAPRMAGPATSLALDLLCCVPALLILIRRAADRSYAIAWSWLHVLMGLLAGWMALSVTWADDQFMAMISAGSFISALALIWALSQLVRSWRRLRIVAAAIVGLLLIYIASGLEYRLLDHPSLVQRWHEVERASTLKQRGWSETEFAFQQYERKVLAGEILSFGASPNTYAAALVLMGVVAGGVVIQRLVNRDGIAWAALPALLLPAAGYVLYYTHSRTAMATAILAAALLGAVALLRKWLAAQAKPAYWIGLGVFALGAVAVIGHGLYHGTLVDQSLTNRWYYWTGAARLTAQNPLTGVGWANFGEHYLAVRNPLAVEEVKDPHNFIVRALVELGIIGGLLMAGWIARLWWEMARPVTPRIAPVSETPGLRLLLGLPALALLINALAGVDFSQADARLMSQLSGGEVATGNAYVINEVFRRVIAFALLAAGIGIAGLRSIMDGQQVRPKMDDRPAPWVLYGLIVGLAVFLIHNLIDFALFETSALFVFALAAGAALGVRRTSRLGETPWNKTALGALIAAGLLWLAAAGGLWLPTASAESAVADADRAIRAGRPGEAMRQYAVAWERQPLNAEYAFRAAQLAAAADAESAYVAGLAESAIAANPRSIKYRLFVVQRELARSTPDLSAVKAAYDRILKLDPLNFILRIEYADALAKLGDPHAAADQYRRALEDNDRLPPGEPRRLTDARRQEVLRK